MLDVRRTIASLLLCFTPLAAHAADGDFVWARGMGGTSDDRGNAIAIDSAGNVYTTGGFRGTVDFDPGASAVNLTSAGGNDIFVQKLDASGNLVWAQRMGGTGTDSGNDIAVDSAGYVYTTGYFRGTADFDPGEESFNLTSVGSDDIFVQKLDASGNIVWARRMGGTGFDSGNGIAVDSAGNVYTTGEFLVMADFDPGAGTANLSSVGEQDIFVQKLDASGNLAWARGMGGTYTDSGRDIALDSAGNIYTTGGFRDTVDFDPGAGTANLSSEEDLDIFVQKLDASGNFVWARGSGGIGNDLGNGIAVDIAGFVLTTGTQDWYCYYGDGGIDLGEDFYICYKQAFIQKYDSDGNLVWARSPVGSSSNGGFAIAVDQSGNVYSTGYFRSGLDFDPGAATVFLRSAGFEDIFLQKMDASGNLVWARGLGGTISDYAFGIAVDNAGNAYTTGYFQGMVDFDPSTEIFSLTSAGGGDIFVHKLSGSPDVVPPSAISITAEVEATTSATSVAFTVTFNEYVQNLDSVADILIAHSGTTSSGVTISGGPVVYTVMISGISGDGSFTVAVNTGSDVQDLVGNPLATSVTSIAVSVDNSGPEFANLVVSPVEASAGDTVAISFDSSEPVAGEPEVTVNGNLAIRTAKADFTYAYTVTPEDALGAAIIEVSGADVLGNPGTLSDGIALTIVQTEGEGSTEGMSEGVVEGVVDGEGASEGAGEGTAEGEGDEEGTIEGTQEGEGEVTVEGAGEGEGEGENPPAGCGGCNASGGPMEKSLGDWLAAFLGLAVLLGAHLSLRSRLET